MGELNLKDTLNLMGNLTLDSTVFVYEGDVKKKKILVQQMALLSPCHGIFPPVIQPPPPLGPSDPGPNVWVTNSFNQTVKIKSGSVDKPIVASGLVRQGNLTAAWPGMVLPGKSKITASGIPVNVEGDQAIIFPSGMVGSLTSSGQ